MNHAIAQDALLKVAESHSLAAVAKRLTTLLDSMKAELAALEERLGALELGGEGRVMDAVRHLLAAGGKRVRPFLCLASGRAFPPARPGSELVSLAQAAELVHGASLMHDDVIDLGERRRGRPAARMVYGNAASVLGGDLLLVEALSMARTVGIPGLLEALLDVLRRMIGAESLQLERRGRTDVSEAEYFEMVAGKTAALFEWCAEAGARAARAPESSVRALMIFAHEVGVAFQLVDDVMDLAQDAARVGKAVLQDIRVGTITYPVIQAVRIRPELEGHLRSAAAAGKEAGIGQAICETVQETGGIEAARAEIARRTKRALRALTRLPVSEARETLAALATKLQRRVEGRWDSSILEVSYPIE